MNKPLILASGSPRRKELLSQLGYTFNVVKTDVEECRQVDEGALDYVSRLSKDKAMAAVVQAPESVVIGSDTIVVCDEQVLEKPDDLAHAKQMLLMLSNRKHQVMTAVTVATNEIQETVVVSTDVWFKTLSEQEIERYWQTGEPCDKAGSYGIQGVGGRFVTRIEGSYHAVVGLPLFETDQLLRKFL
ncbi:septum formation inhibitor Maf [Vibrio sp. RE86]|uniref:Maf family protein n=1 Tax=Vibrio sp. RE86 TaxID=2607605 RepID=UPI0014937627|nr:Maf family protein [Vibrio sp. RE86]NOH80935.1 septum formation inhibitor Maf [Vibrio sp. RE86]